MACVQKRRLQHGKMALLAPRKTASFRHFLAESNRAPV
jgi:hypothetical protein